MTADPLDAAALIRARDDYAEEMAEQYDHAPDPWERLEDIGIIAQVGKEELSDPECASDDAYRATLLRIIGAALCALRDLDAHHAGG